MKAAAAEIELSNVSKQYGSAMAVRNISLKVHAGELVALLGPSGCGKTTTLRIISGFVEPDTGSLRIAGKLMNAVPPQSRNLGMLPQQYALFPHMSVFDNVAFGLRMRKESKVEIERRVSEALAMVRMESMRDRFPAELSGGQQQRVGLARAIVINPSVLLLDEPMAALDRKLRTQMQLEIRGLQRRLGISTILVTHDQEEALTMADRIAVMEGGQIIQIGSPREIYERPASQFVSDFIGTSNLLPGTIVARDSERATVSLDGFHVAALSRDGAAVGDNVSLAIRPEALTITAPGSSQGNCASLPGELENVIYLGAVVYYQVKIGQNSRLTVMEKNSPGEMPKVGDAVTVQWPAEQAMLFR